MPDSLPATPPAPAAREMPLVWPKTYDSGTAEATSKAFADDFPAAAKAGYRIGSQTWAGSSLTVIYQRDGTPGPKVISATEPTPRAPATSTAPLYTPPPRGEQVERPVPASLTVGGIAVAAGGVLALAGTVLPWITASSGLLSISRNGWDIEGGHAGLIAGVGVITVLIGLFSLAAPRASTKVWDMTLGWWGPALAATVGILALGVVDLSDIDKRVKGADDVIATVGMGIYVVLGGGLLAGVGALAAASAEQPSAPHV